MERDSINILQHFIDMEEQRSHIQLKGFLQAEMDYLEYVIRSEFDKNAKDLYKFKKRKAELDEQLIHAINSMNREEKVKYYQGLLDSIKRIDSGDYNPPNLPKQVLTSEGFTRSLNLKMWKKKKLKLDVEKHILYAEKSTKIKHYNLQNYLVRQSKNKDYHTIVLEAINNIPHQTSRTVHLGFTDVKLYKAWYQSIQQSIHFKNWQSIKKAIGKDNTMYTSNVHTYKHQNLSSPNSQVKQYNLDALANDSSDEQVRVKADDKSNKKQLFKDDEQTSKFKEEKNNTIVDSLMQSDNDEEIYKIPDKEKRQSQQKKHLDLFHKILPQYQLEDLQNDENYESVVTQNNFIVIQNRVNRLKLKVYIKFNNNISNEAIFGGITNTNFLTTTNDALQQLSIKTMIASQNSAIIYQKNKAYNKLYRARDFIYLRHAFSNGGDLYIVDKSIQNSNYPPFITIVRGKLCILWGILKRSNRTTLIIDIEQTNQGYLNQLQEVNLTMVYINGLKNLQQKIRKQVNNLSKFKIFDLGWDITKNQNNKITNEIRKRKKTERLQIKQPKQVNPKNNIPEISFKNSQIITNNSKFISLKNLESQKALLQQKKAMEVVGEIDIKQLEMRQKQKTVLSIVRKVDSEGYVIIEKQYLKSRFRIEPFKSMQHVYQEVVVDHPIWKGEWLHDDNEGGIIFINQKKIDDQKGVIKFILAKIGKNILSGKGILNISLPVDIFSPESNLQRLIFSMTYAPIFLEKANKKPSLEKLKLTIAFGISNSPLYLNMEKPFNPILGETFQCWINGCPAYAQQISHHPPVAAILMVGRGYRISAQLQSKVQLHMNSGCGTNEGIYRVRFDDKGEVCFVTPGGEISGLTYGDRKFNIVGKSYYWIESDNLLVEIVFNPSKKGFFSIGKQQNPSDYFQGNIYQVKPQFMKSFLAKRKAPNEKEIEKCLGKISGIWNKYINFQNECLLDLNTQYPLKLQYEPQPLPSDANWREDIHYRRIMEVTRAQTEKERLQVLQRSDRKLRQTKGKKK